MNSEIEKQYLILLSIFELGGQASKEDVLNHIESNDYLNFSEKDFQTLETRPELKWRNDLAFVRDHLKNAGYIDPSERGIWKTTDFAKDYFNKITAQILAENELSLKKVTASALISGLDFLQSLRLDENLPPTKESVNLPAGSFGGSVIAQILARRGQKKFREGLLSRYGNRCLITDCKILDLIEAAHIIPFRLEQSHNLDNGLLMRSDIHTLFDLNLLGIDLDYRVRLNPKIINEYGYLSEKQIVLTENQKPDITKVESKWREFEKYLAYR